jgi:hypothetical protein
MGDYYNGRGSYYPGREDGPRIGHPTSDRP